MASTASFSQYSVVTMATVGMSRPRSTGRSSTTRITADTRNKVRSLRPPQKRPLPSHLLSILHHALPSPYCFPFTSCPHTSGAHVLSYFGGSLALCSTVPLSFGPTHHALPFSFSSSALPHTPCHTLLLMFGPKLHAFPFDSPGSAPPPLCFPHHAPCWSAGAPLGERSHTPRTTSVMRRRFSNSFSTTTDVIMSCSPILHILKVRKATNVTF